MNILNQLNVQKEMFCQEIKNDKPGLRQSMSLRNPKINKTAAMG
jgi:hypothetical protein